MSRSCTTGESGPCTRSPRIRGGGASPAGGSPGSRSESSPWWASPAGSSSPERASALILGPPLLRRELVPEPGGDLLEVLQRLVGLGLGLVGRLSLTRLVAGLQVLGGGQPHRCEVL